MKNYKGYYIDNITFKSEVEIDDFIKEQAVEAYRVAVELFIKNCNMETSTYCDEKAEKLISLGYTWSEVEELEIKFMKIA